MEECTGASSSLVPVLALEEAFGKPYAVNPKFCLVLLLCRGRSDILVKLYIEQDITRTGTCKSDSQC